MKETKEEETLIHKLEYKFYNWLVMKGWAYILVFFLGMAIGGLIWK